MKKRFFTLCFLLFSLVLNASNENTFNSFENFSTPRMAIPKIPSFTIITTESNQYSFYPQINVGNYLSFRATREASINSYEFFSDVLKKDFQVYEMNKKGKITYTSEVYKYDHSDFFNAYQKGVESDRAEAREVGITLAGVKKNNSDNEYKITTYSTRRGLIPFPLNIAYYVKKVDDSKVLWSMDEDFSNPDYTFTINSNKVIITDKKGNLHTTFYRENDSLFIEASGKKSAKYEIRVNREASQFEYYKDGKQTGKTMYKLVD